MLQARSLRSLWHMRNIYAGFCAVTHEGSHCPEHTIVNSVSMHAYASHHINYKWTSLHQIAYVYLTNVVIWPV